MCTVSALINFEQKKSSKIDFEDINENKNLHRIKSNTTFEKRSNIILNNNNDLPNKVEIFNMLGQNLLSKPIIHAVKPTI